MHEAVNCLENQFLIFFFEWPLKTGLTVLLNHIVDKREEPIPLMSWKYAVDRVPWGVIFLLGSGFCIAKATKVSITQTTQQHKFCYL